MDKPNKYALNPCGHKLYCKECAEEMVKHKMCAYCKKYIESYLEIFN